MKKIIFSGICMLISSVGIIVFLLITLNLYERFGPINGNSSIQTYLDLVKITPIFNLFFGLGIIGFVIGLWGVFEEIIEKIIEKIIERKKHNAKI